MSATSIRLARMRSQARRLGPLAALAASTVLAATLLAVDPVAADGKLPNLRPFPDPSGQFSTFSTGGAIDTNSLFFQSLGSNGRACSTCHVPADAWSITPADVQARFQATGGMDPIFRTNDGANAPSLDVSTVDARKRAYSMLLNKGLIRVGIGIPSGAEFELVRADDPYGYASSAELSLFRRPLPSTNLPFLTTVMWDGRETLQPITSTSTAPSDTKALQFDLADQAKGAVLGHAQGTVAPTPEQLQRIVAFEMGLFTAQTADAAAGDLKARGATGGPAALATQPFHVGINDPFAPNFNPVVFDLFQAWGIQSVPTPSAAFVAVPQPTAAAQPSVARGQSPAPTEQGPTRVPAQPSAARGTALPNGTPTVADPPATTSQQSVARGEALFNTRQFQVTGVGGLNDALGRASITATCTTCHNTPGVGNHSSSLPLNLGLSDASRRTPDQPLYTLRNLTTQATLQTTDPGRALITGKWADVGKFKGAILRGLAGRAPYFHNGSAATLDQVVEFYDNRFSIGLSAQEHADLVAFLRAL